MRGAALRARARAAARPGRGAPGVPSDALLALDIGNTNVTAGAFGPGGRLERLWRLATDRTRTSDEYGAALAAMLASGPAPAVGAVVYGSVVPALNPVFESAVRGYLGVEPVAVTVSSPLGVPLKVDRPHEVGVDRLLNALAVTRLWGGPAIVVDFGTATTFDCVSARGEYLGGAILPGPKLAAEALASRTAQLPLVEIRRPSRVIGKNTVECLQAGLYFGYLGMIEAVLERSLREMGAREYKQAAVYATGGLAGLFAPEFKRLRNVVPDLTLQGLRLAYEAVVTKT